MVLINGGVGGGDTIPPSGGGGGSITLIESTDSSVLVTDGGGPTVDLSVSSGSLTYLSSANNTNTALPAFPPSGGGGTPELALTTGSLAVGTWLLSVSGYITGPAATSVLGFGSVFAGVGSATAVLSGFTNGGQATLFQPGVACASPIAPVVLSFIAEVTVEGTLTATAFWTDTAGAGESVLGYTALKVA